MGGGETKRRIKLFCPSVSKIVEIVEFEEQRLDLGSIAGAFGLEPATLKLNGHFISRGVNLIACSVTWKSLLSFFSAKGLSTGATDSDALIVDGKLSKLGSKRKHDPTDLGRTLVAEQHGISGPNENRQLGHSELVSNKRFKDGSADLITGSNCLSLKRKLFAGDANPLKKTRTNETTSGFEERNDDLSRSMLNGQFSCSIVDDNMKRIREDDLVVFPPCKRSR